MIKRVLVTGYQEWETVYYNHFKIWNVTKKLHITNYEVY